MRAQPGILQLEVKGIGMRIAVASDGLDVADYFLQCKNINYYTTCSLKIADSKNVPTEGFACDQYAELMDSIGVDALICGSMPEHCRLAFENYGIDVVEGASGNALQAANAYVARIAEDANVLA